MLIRLLKAIVGGLLAAFLTSLVLRFLDDAPMRTVAKLMQAEEDMSDQEAEAILRELASLT